MDFYVYVRTYAKVRVVGAERGVVVEGRDALVTRVSLSVVVAVDADGTPFSLVISTAVRVVVTFTFYKKQEYRIHPSTGRTQTSALIF